MKDVLKIKTAENFKPIEIAEALSLHIFSSVVGFILTKTTVFNRFIPFGLSFLAGCPQTFSPAAAIGVFFGYFFPAIGNGAFRYIAAMFAVLAVKLMLNGYKNISENPVFLSFICFLSVFLTSAVALRETKTVFFSSVSESIFSAGGTFLFCFFFKSIKMTDKGLSVEELIFLFLPVSILITGFNFIKFNGISSGAILGFFLTFAAAKYGGAVSGSVCGISLSFLMFLNGSTGSTAIIFAFTGLLSGLFSSYGKYVQTVVPLLFSLITLFYSSDVISAVSAIIELLFGSALFLMLPRSIGIFISKVFADYPRVVTPTGVKRRVTMRLQAASNALSDVSQTVEQVSSELSRLNAPDFDRVLTLVEQDACAGCKLRLHCWESKKAETVNALIGVTKVVKKGVHSPKEGLTDEFNGRCIRVAKVVESTAKHYTDYISLLSAENRIEEVRHIVSDQFEGISQVLLELANDLNEDIKYDNVLADKAAGVLKNLNIQTEECNCRIDKYGRVQIELKIVKEPSLVLNKLKIMKLTSVVCERDFDVPVINENGKNVFIILNERAALRVDIGVEQKCSSETSICGDAYEYFYDGRGHFVMILSDGMGTGGRAAVDGAMASGLMARLIKAGFGYDSALKIINSSMLFKSSDESLATVDVVNLDLFTGKTELFKAGAAPTVIRRSGRTGKAESSSLPAGILNNVSFDKAILKCKPGDIITVLSDGATVDGTDWIRDEINNWTDGTAQELSQKLCEGARRRRNGERTDDITVMCAIIKKAF